MKYFFLILSTVLFVSCINDNPKDIEIEKSIGNIDKQSKIPASLGIGKIINYGHNYNFEDLNEFYRSEVVKHKGESYYSNLQEIVISEIFDKKFLLTSSDDDLMFYLQENIDMEVNLLSLYKFYDLLSVVRHRNLKSVEKLNTIAKEFEMKNLTEINNIRWSNEKLRDQKIEELRAGYLSYNRWGS